MDKRLEKRHKRQVARARAKVKTSEPDVRTPEQIAEARSASQASANLRGAGNSVLPGATGGPRTSRSTTQSTAAKREA